jgi:hypothetical protein
MGKVSVGFFSFTEITDSSEHRSYNEWHQLDHMPEQYPLAGIVAGQRWVSTPACRARRAVSEGLLDPIHYMTLYLMGEPLETTLAGFKDLAARLRVDGRFHSQRRSRLSGPFDRESIAVAGRVRISAEAVPYRPNRGVYVVVEGRSGPRHPEHPDRLVPLTEVDGVVGAWAFSAGAHAESREWLTGEHRITVCWLDDDPLAVAGRLEPVLARQWAEDAVTPVLAGPFESITPWAWDWFDDTAGA